MKNLIGALALLVFIFLVSAKAEADKLSEVKTPAHSAKTSTPKKFSFENMVLIPEGDYTRPYWKTKFKVKSKKGHDLWINNFTVGYSVITEEISEKYKEAMEKDPSLKEKLKGRKVVEVKSEFHQSHVVPLKLRNAMVIQFSLPELDFGDPLIIDYVVEHPNPVSKNGKPSRTINERHEYNAAHSFYSKFGGGAGFGWMFDEREDPALLQTGNWSVTLFNNGKKITKIHFMAVSPGKEKDSQALTVKDENLTIRKVHVDSFYMDKYEVTRQEYKNVIGHIPIWDSQNEKEKALPGNLPVNYIQWVEAKEYCKKVGKHLPTEAEWEWAARGGTKTAYPWGDEVDPKMANFCDTNCSGDHKMTAYDDGYKDLAPVGSFPPNGYGLYDMIGNQVEWASDWFDIDYYRYAPSENPAGPEYGREKVQRGGSYWAGSNNFRADSRRKSGTVFSGMSGPSGFRCALSKTGTLKQLEWVRYLEGKKPETGRDYNGMAPSKRKDWQARDTLRALERACRKFKMKNGRSKECRVKDVSNREFGFKNPYGYAIKEFDNNNEIRASIETVEEGFDGKPQSVKYVLKNQRGTIERIPGNSTMSMQSGGCEENLDKSLGETHQEQMLDTSSCGVDKVSIAVSEWECAPASSRLKGLCEKRPMNCSRLYSCRPATEEEAYERFNQAMDFQVVVALNRLSLACRAFFKSEGKQGACTQDTGRRVARGLGDVTLEIKGEGQNFTATSTGTWKDRKGNPQKAVYRLNHKGEIKRVEDQKKSQGN